MTDSEEYERLIEDEKKVYVKIRDEVNPEDKKKLYSELGTIGRRKTKLLKRM